MDTPESEIIQRLLFQPLQSPLYKQLNSIGNDFYKVVQYANEHVIDDSFTQAMVNLVSAQYFIGIAPIVQVLFALNTAKELGQEYVFSVLLRSLTELVGRVHKVVRLYETFQKNGDADNLLSKSKRLLRHYVKVDQQESNVVPLNGFNVMTLVKSLQDKIPDIEEKYDDLSTYFHGEIITHSLYRKMTHFQQLAGQEPTAISAHDEFVHKLIDILITDLMFIREVVKPLINRYTEKHTEI
ncbi:hypothetical protein [Alicyclobacillus suci]|uniref:hypothetical protein n=1 Tax=Alicyclobacillus suci TaxID=2816080 RepID=UPI001A8E6092|nr:hypothetical protein [Alicyclobacillus suci]